MRSAPEENNGQCNKSKCTKGLALDNSLVRVYTVRQQAHKWILPWGQHYDDFDEDNKILSQKFLPPRDCLSVKTGVALMGMSCLQYCQCHIEWICRQLTVESICKILTLYWYWEIPHFMVQALLLLYWLLSLLLWPQPYSPTPDPIQIMNQN